MNLDLFVHKWINLVIILFFAFIFIGCVKQESSSYKIGLTVPLTGSGAIGGEAVKNGIIIATDEINSEGGINGHPIEIVIEDTKSTAADAVTAFSKLVDVDGLPVIIGGVLSPEAVSQAPRAEAAGVVLLSPTSGTTAIKHSGDWVFKLRESMDDHARVLLEEMSKRGIHRLGTVTASYEAADDLMQYMHQFGPEYNITIVHEEKYGIQDTDMRTQLEKLRGSTIDAWLQGGLYQDAGFVFKQAKEVGLSKPAFSIFSIENKKFFEIAGYAGEGTIFSSTKFSCVDAPHFCEQLMQQYNMTPDYRSAFGYDSLKIVAEAINRKGYTAKGIQQGILSIQNFPGATGLTSFDNEGNAKKQIIVKQIKGNTFVALGKLGVSQ